ncbi:MAG: FtsX-like permease family protein [Oscillospiraceae bacterium]|nr:FtsX-like permease family protein [Oscillospiraceae bacterium]
MILLKKAVRSIWRGKRSYIACILLMAFGIMVYLAFGMSHVNLRAAADTLYEEQRFADAFALVRDMPVSAAGSLASVTGVAAVDGRITANARVMAPGRENQIITLKIHSFDPDETNPINAFLLTRGTAPGENEILIGDPFFLANGYEVGDTVDLIISGTQVSFTVSGAAQSPEYVYVIPDTGALLPDNETFGFAYVTYSQLASITGRQGLCDNISFILDDGVRFENVKTVLEDALAPYGLISVFAQKDQASAAMIEQEINSIGSMAQSVPMVFIMMAVIILYIMLKRVIEQERGSIGTLKAFGYSDAQIITHYACYGIITGGLGGVAGCAGGLAVSGFFTDLFLEYFNLPALTSSPDPRLIFYGMAIALISGAFGAFMGTRSVMKLLPGEAMRPPAPKIIKNDIFKKLPFLRMLLAPNGFMAVRNITRSGFRSAFIVLGIAFSFSLIALTNSFPEMMDKIMLEQYTKVQVYDVKISLSDPRPFTAATEAVFGIAGVTQAEGLLEVPAELRLLNLRENVVITGLETGSRLQRIYDTTGEFYLEAPRGGLIISQSLANKINARRGDTLMVKTPYTGDRDIPAPVLGIVNENLGMTAYMELESLCAMLEVPKSASAVILNADDMPYVKQTLSDAGNVSAVTDQNDSRRIYEDMMQTYSSLYTFMSIAGMAVAYAIITNTSSVSLSERKREYATLRVLGMYPREIGRILGFEYFTLTAIGMIPGVPLVRMLKMGMANMMDASMFTVPLSTPLSSYITAGVLCVVTVALSNFTSARHIAKFDMVDVLKERE